VTRHLSFWTLVVLTIALGVLFFRVIQPFFAPLFFAAVIALLAHPLHEWTVDVLGGRRRAAAFVAVSLFLICLIPITLVLITIGREVMLAGQELSQTNLEDQPAVRRLMAFIHRFFPQAEWEGMRGSLARALETTTQAVFNRTREFLSDVVAFGVGVAVMGLALYYFLAEGPLLLKKLHRLFPLDGREEHVLFDKFGGVCRGLVLGTLVCAVAQAALLAVGLLLAGVKGVWVLAGLTLLFSMIPFIGSAGVWLPVAAWLLWQGRIWAGIFLGIYGAAVVSTSDNLIRAHVLHGTARIHPLLALVSALGGLQLVGLWGIFLGPIVAALFYTLVKVLHDRLEALEEEPRDKEHGNASPGTDGPEVRFGDGGASAPAQKCRSDAHVSSPPAVVPR
jgi:predicted PurR-regulated permease PerM